MSLWNSVVKFLTGKDLARQRELKARMAAAEKVNQDAEDTFNDSIVTNNMAHNLYETCRKEQDSSIKECRKRLATKFADIH